MQQSPPPTLKQIAKKLNMSSSSALRAREASLCGQLLMLRENWRSGRQEQAKLILLSGIEQDDIPSFRKFCKATGIPMSLVISRLPEIKRAYDARYRSLRMAQRARRIEQFQHEVENTVRLLRERNEYPSAGRVIAENPHLRSGGWDQLQRAIRLAQSANVTSERQPAV
jgi:peroxiredoxin